MTKQIGHGLFIGILSLLDILSTSSEFIGFDMKSLFWSFENVVWARVKMTFPASIFHFSDQEKGTRHAETFNPKISMKKLIKVFTFPHGQPECPFVEDSPCIGNTQNIT